MTMVINDVEYVPAAAAAAQLATTEMKILMLLKNNALSGEMIDGSWFVTAASLAGYRPSAEAGQVPGCRTSCSGSGCGCH